MVRDIKYQIVKTATIFGLFGAYRWKKRCNLTVDDIEHSENSLLIYSLPIQTNRRHSLDFTLWIYVIFVGNSLSTLWKHQNVLMDTNKISSVAKGIISYLKLSDLA